MRDAAGQPSRGPTSHLYRNGGDGTFIDVTAKAGLTARGWGQAVCAGDIDNDGDTDLLVTYYGRLVLYRNNGDGTFTDVDGGQRSARRSATLEHRRRVPRRRSRRPPRSVRLGLRRLRGRAAPRPGSRPRLLLEGVPVMCGPQGLAGSQNALFRGQGDGTFVDVSGKAGLLKAQPAFGFTPLVLDYDNDGWPDVYVANDSIGLAAVPQQQGGGFTDVGLRAGVALTADGRAQAGMGVAAADYDRDGWLDIVKTNFDDDTTSLYRNLGDGSFEDATLGGRARRQHPLPRLGHRLPRRRPRRLAGPLRGQRPRLPAGRPGRRPLQLRAAKVLYRNGGAGRFEDVSERAGPGILAATAARGAAVGDLFGTGRQDIVVNNMHAAPSLLHDCDPAPDPTPSPSSWSARARTGARIGARVVVTAGGRRQIDEVRSGGSFGSQHAMALFFGLGTRAAVDRIEVTWPSGARDVVAATRRRSPRRHRGGGRIVRQEPFVARRRSRRLAGVVTGSSQSAMHRRAFIQSALFTAAWGAHRTRAAAGQPDATAASGSSPPTSRIASA